MKNNNKTPTAIINNILKFKQEYSQIAPEMKDGYCRDHKNTAELICLHRQCGSRLMCMLCEHHHETFTSVRAKNVVDWRRFRKLVDESIDRSLKIVDQIEQGGIEKEKKMAVQYYAKLKEDLVKFVDLRMNQNLAIFNSKSNSNLQFLIRSRIQGKYHELEWQQFEKIKQVYEGKNLQQIARHEQQMNLENAYTYMEEFHRECEQLFTKFKIELKIKIPQIRIKSQLSVNRIHVENYDEQIYRSKQKENIKYASNVDIQMMVTDGYSGKKEIIMLGFDKILRVFDKNLCIITSKEYGNVLTRIEPIGDSIFAIGVSKQLHINKISHQDGFQPKQILKLKGHTQRIWDISSFNTRIIGSCSQQGTKVWDLYKQKCEYTLCEQINPSCLRFMPSVNMLSVGYHSHDMKIYSISTMKPSRSYQLAGVPLYMSQENRNQNVIYCGGFNSDLNLFDIRVAKEVFCQQFKSEAVTTFKQSIFEEETLLIGERGGKARIFDLRKLKTRLEWQAHPKTTNLSKPNGVVRIFQEGFNEVLTIGSNDRKGIIWELKNQQ